MAQGFGGEISTMPLDGKWMIFGGFEPILDTQDLDTQDLDTQDLDTQDLDTEEHS